ncbi:hypothetical protein CEXT_601431 [Caerostris extrusa]|uniref:Uncharacterized protein n=1 Tax=Caerostris extrusa TaxID=172846 RepID=A0AAV4QJH2_CAEEX|nr:hypothetical protein CEXT_601431 [Caerostris extrusa]
MAPLSSANITDLPLAHMDNVAEELKRPVTALEVQGRRMKIDKNELQTSSFLPRAIQDRRSTRNRHLAEDGDVGRNCKPSPAAFAMQTQHVHPGFHETHRLNIFARI